MLERILDTIDLYINSLQKDYPKALTDNLWQVIINLRKYSDSQPRDDHGRWTDGGGGDSSSSGGGSAKPNESYSDSSGGFLPITQSAIDNIPKIDVFDDPKVNTTVHNVCREILTDLKKDKIGTEESISFDLKLTKRRKIKGAQGEGGVKISKLDTPYISVHNHPSGKTFSVKDLVGFHDDKNCRGIVVVGNNGKIFAMKKTSAFQSTGFFEYCMKRQYGFFSFKSEKDFMKGAEKYGVKYYERTN